MKGTNLFLIITTLVVGGLIGTSDTNIATAENAFGTINESTTCSVATLNGPYGIYSTGNTSNGELARVGIAIHDGKGNWTLRTQTSRNGKFESGKGSGRTQVAADCSIKVLDESGTQLSWGFIVDDGKGLFLLNRTPGNAVVTIGRKIHTQ